MLAVLTLLGYAGSLRQPFSNDDFTFLAKVRATPLARLLGGSDLLAGWWRPWSRELHFWAIDRLSGGSTLAFHLVNLALWFGVLGLLLALLRRLADARVAAIVAAGVTASACWGLFVVWACCSQDLWMLLMGLAFLLAAETGHVLAASAALALALLSKETAIAVLPLAIAMRWARDGVRGLRARAHLAYLGVALAWFALHPSLGGRWWFGSGLRIVPVARQPWTADDLLWLLAPFNLESAPRPDGPWAPRLAEGLAWALGLGALAWRSIGAPAPAVERARLVKTGLVWWAFGWAPMVLPFLRWHSYYGWFGLCGAWLALTASLARSRAVLVPAIVAIALLRPFAAHTWINDWGTEEYQRVAAGQLDQLRLSLRAQQPHLAPHARVFLANLPPGVGFHTGVRRSAPLGVWYRDTTLLGCLFGEYEARRPRTPAGPDYFFVVDDRMRLLPVADGRTPVPDSLRRAELWPVAEEQIAHAFTLSHEHARALAAFRRLAETYPDNARAAYNLAEAFDDARDPRRGLEWRNRADSLVGSPPRAGRAYLEVERAQAQARP